ncbi:VOC family protein [Paenibacillus sp. CF384]|uniref:VOC family protein n=1 Tax=Paenibacillus sp. CF384 TaxID=1884382 RepID=UPI00089920EA|nr:VOC family protein [Paenibacillus sp. CF384]SDX07080.1 Glyoxalase/Bleomycin resistance protein/Dioxygenase superfamily protein [Paenibacillus sp. CF384]
MVEQAVTSPIKPIVPAIFVNVTNVRKSVDWYCNLLGLPIPEETREGMHIFDLSGSQCSNIFLEKRDEVTPSAEPLFSLTAPDHEAAFQFLTQLGVEIIRKDEEVILFKDLDGNVLMACSI